ncbi:MAG: long-chain fatty acid--CoA ligase [Dermatophilaceae bacterium]
MDNGFGNWPTMHALRNPARPAFIDGSDGSVLTWRDFEARTNSLADALSQHGVQRGDRVALLTLNSVAMMEIYFAVAKLGAITVPINLRLSAPEVAYVLADSGASFAFVSGPMAPLLEAASSEVASLRTRVTIPVHAERAAGGPNEYEELLASGSPERVTRDVSLDDLCVIMYTSGTTGRPKGAMLTHDNFLWNAINIQGFGAGVSRQDLTLSAAPLFHIGALGVHTMPLAFFGGATVVMESFTPEGWLDLAEKHRITVAFNVPAMWAAIAQAESLRTRDLSALTFAVSGGSPCPIVVIKAMQAAGMAFTEGFGMTETAPIAACLQPEDVLEHAGSIGRPVGSVDFRIVDEDGRDVPTGEVGELAMRGPNVFVGYWGKPQATAEAIRGGWFHTGDLGRVDEEGFYTLVDRKKDMVITGGENVYPIEVEQVIYEHADVMEVAVTGAPDDKWGEMIVATVVRRTESTLSEDELIAWTRERIAGFKTPRRVQFVDALPRNATGKVLKRELRKQWSGEGSQVTR